MRPRGRAGFQSWDAVPATVWGACGIHRGHSGGATTRPFPGDTEPRGACRHGQDSGRRETAQPPTGAHTRGLGEAGVVPLLRRQPGCRPGAWRRCLGSAAPPGPGASTHRLLRTSGLGPRSGLPWRRHASAPPKCGGRRRGSSSLDAYQVIDSLAGSRGDSPGASSQAGCRHPGAPRMPPARGWPGGPRMQSWPAEGRDRLSPRAGDAPSWRGGGRGSCAEYLDEGRVEPAHACFHR